MKFFFKTNANQNIGSGHLQRCLNLARVLKGKNQIYFLLTKTSTSIVKKLRNEFKIINFKDDKDILKKAKTIFKHKKDSFLIIDDYSINYKWEKIISGFFYKTLVICDDISKKHYCNLYLNQNILDIQSNIKIQKKYKENYLVGPKYALLDKNYSLLLKKKAKKRNKLKNILISFGGSDKENLTERVLELLAAKKYNFNVIVILGNSYQYSFKLKKKFKNFKNITFHKNLKSLAKIYYNTDLSIGAGGISSWERICFSIPSLVFQVSKNQKFTIDNLKKKKMIIYAGKETNFNKHKFKQQILHIKNNFIKIKKQSQDSDIFVDGYGASRVAEILMPSTTAETSLKKASKSDVYSYYNWANDKDVRASSFNQKKILLQDHKKWFYKQLRYPKKNLLYIFKTNKVYLGQTRLNISHKTAKIDYSIDRDFRKKGLGSYMLKLVLKKNKSKKLRFYAEVKKDNVKSINIFKNLKFKSISKKNKIIFEKFN